MSGLLPAKDEPPLPHDFDDVAVADRSAQQLAIPFRQHPLQPQIRHDRGHHGVPRQHPARQQSRAQDGHDLVAIDDFPALVGKDHPIRVSVERDADRGVGAAHLGGNLLGMKSAAIVIDVAPVGLGG